MTTDELYRMAYNAEFDGYDRKWHNSFARDRRELDALTRGATAAAKDAEHEEASANLKTSEPVRRPR
jgi:hypothetical protein